MPVVDRMQHMHAPDFCSSGGRSRGCCKVTKAEELHEVDQMALMDILRSLDVDQSCARILTFSATTTNHGDSLVDRPRLR
jgi:hypothetical protein